MISPSLSSGVNENGPGLSEKDAVIRGFGDGEYNVTYDGIPFADTNDPTHHTTAYFPASTIGAAEVDRGPGGRAISAKPPSAARSTCFRGR